MTQYKLFYTPDKGNQWINADTDTIENPAHYSKYPISPTEYNVKNKLEWREGNVVKYITRWQDKDGRKDLLKARKYINMILEELDGSVEVKSKSNVQEQVL